MQFAEKAFWSPKWEIERFEDDRAFFGGLPYSVSNIDHNLLLNEGIGELLDLACGLGSPSAFNAANARIGVGDSATAATEVQTGLVAATNKLYKAMNASFPSRTNQTALWKSTFESGEANWAWNEFTIANGASDAAKNLNRLVSAQGTKIVGQVWTITLSVTIS